jgi:two-component system phosphate regulon sensor histidine kinase PhoR
MVFHDITEMRRLETVRQEFVTNASHELKTPLTVIQGYVETLTDEGFKNEKKRSDYLKTIAANVRRLALLIEDMLKLSQLESSRVEIELLAIDMATVCEQQVERLREKAALKRIELRLNFDEQAKLVIQGDRRGAGEIVSNLVDNAIKYSPIGSAVEIRLQRILREIVLTVTDSGPGIAPQELPRIFERFYRVDKGRGHDVGGTGLGLAIVKHWVQRMRGRIEVESEIGRGSTFATYLPVTEILTIS